jgi:NADH-quinone oxidoreductase subunit F/NAD(P)H dehydrogenase (quinone)/NADP-reducing hydrogenase subunit HndC
MNKVTPQLMLCGGTGCHASATRDFKTALQKELDRQGLAEEIKIIETGCNGFCAVGPVMLVQPEGIFYQKLKVKDAPHLVEEHFLKGRPVKKIILCRAFLQGNHSDHGANPIFCQSDVLGDAQQGDYRSGTYR